jgi:hypothetical protein
MEKIRCQTEIGVNPIFDTLSTRALTPACLSVDLPAHAHGPYSSKQQLLTAAAYRLMPRRLIDAPAPDSGT